MELVQEGAAKPTPIEIKKIAAATECTSSKNVPCFANLNSGKFILFLQEMFCFLIIPFSCIIDSYNVTIKGNMKNSKIEYTISASGSPTFTSLVAQFIPLTCTASIVTPITGIIVATARAMFY